MALDFRVCGLVTPWNYPLMMLSWKMAACLAAGNTVVHKPAQVSPLTALKFAELSAKAGIPKGVINILPGSGKRFWHQCHLGIYGPFLHEPRSPSTKGWEFHDAFIHFRRRSWSSNSWSSRGQEGWFYWFNTDWCTNYEKVSSRLNDVFFSAVISLLFQLCSKQFETRFIGIRWKITFDHFCWLRLG